MKGWAYSKLYRPETVPEGFRDMDEAMDFVEAQGSYSGNNSFNYTDEDLEAWSSEGFFNTPECLKCFLEASPEEDVDAEFDLHVTTTEEDSFQVGKNRQVTEYFYGCRDHPETGIKLIEEEFV